MERREMGGGKASVMEAIVSVEPAALPQARPCGTRIVDRHIDSGSQRGKSNRGKNPEPNAMESYARFTGIAAPVAGWKEPPGFL